MKKKTPFPKGVQMFAGLMLSAIVVIAFLYGGTAAAAGLSCMFTLPLVSNLKAKGIKMTEEQEKFFGELEAGINSEMAKYLGNLATNKALDDKLEAFKAEHGKGLTEEKQKELDEIINSVKLQGAELQKLKDGGISAERGGSILKAIKDSDEKIKNFLKSKNGSVEIEIKATQLPTDIETHTIGDYAPGIGQQPVRQPFIEDLFPTVNTTKEYIKYLDQETVVRDAKNVAGNAASTHNTKLTWKERSIQITKVRDFIDLSQDMLDDYEFVEGEVRNLLDSSLALKVDSGLLTDDGVHPNLHSIDEAASEFDAANTLSGTIDAWTASVKDPNFFDLVIAMCSQIIALGKDNGFMPNAVLINTVDKYKNMLIKDANGQYLMPPFVVRANNKDYTIDGMVVRSNPIVEPNTLFVCDTTKGTKYQRRGAVIELSYENRSNFETETVTMKVYRRLQLLIRNVNKNAFMKCSDVEAALEAIKKV